ncbi:MAG: ABC transporter ATP-binding protein [Pseudomonadales bacterium]
MIKVENLSKYFNRFKAVDDVSFSVAPGEVLGFLGPNGAGKSTTMKVLSGFIEPSGGTATIFDHDIVREPVAAKKLIGYLPEGAPAYDDMTALQFLQFIAAIRGLGGHATSRIDNVVDLLTLQEVLHRPIDTLSKGFKRRVGIAQALLHDPKVLILDEPTDGLDPIQKHQVRELIKNLAADKIVIVSTHILEEVNAVCTRAIVIANGKLVADATPEELEAQSDFHGAVTLQLVNAGEVQSQLAALQGVKRIEVDEQNSARLTLIPQPGEKIIAPVQQLVQQNNWQLDELFVERGRLDDVFRSLACSAETRGAA